MEKLKEHLADVGNNIYKQSAVLEDQEYQGDLRNISVMNDHYSTNPINLAAFYFTANHQGLRGEETEIIWDEAA